MLLAGAVGCRRGADSRADSAVDSVADSAAARVATASEEPREIIGGDTLLAEPLRGLQELAPEELLQSVGSNGSEYLFLEIRDWETGEIPTEFIKDKLYSIRLSYRPGLEAGDKPLYKYLFGKIKIAADYQYFGPTKKIVKLTAVASPSDTITEYRCVYVSSNILAKNARAEPFPAVLIKKIVATGEVIELRYRNSLKRKPFPINDDRELYRDFNEFGYDG